MDINVPALRYYGGKWRLAPWIIEHFPMPSVVECYVEPYCGAASVLLRKPPSPIEVINDLDCELVNFFRVLRERTDELIRAIRLTPFSRREHERSWGPMEGLTALERARRYYVRSWQGWGGGRSGDPSGWRFQRKEALGNLGTDAWNRIEHLFAIAERLKNVFIECDEALRIIERYDASRTLFYLDPPYLPTLRGDGNRHAYRHDVDGAYHRRLLEIVQGLEGMVILSGYPSEQYDDMLGDSATGWHRVAKVARTTKAKKAREVLWLSPAVVANQRQMRLWKLI
jgi:DNA adenine methylase